MRIGIVGAGVSGLACAWLLKRLGVEVKVFEQQPHVGGLARSFLWNGFTCDFATHRLFAHDAQVLQELLALVPMARHTRRSRIWLAGRWLGDPVNIVELLYRHPSVAPQVAWDYVSRPRNEEPDSFQDYVTARYGTKLHDFFFAPYTEKLFGIESEHISAEWARRKVRIGGMTSFLRESSKKHFSYFYYPIRGGYGAIVDRFYQDLKDQVLVEAPVQKLTTANEKVTGVVYRHQGQEQHEEFSQVISTVALPILGKILGQDFSLPYRGASAVYLLVNRPLLTPYHWLYFMDRDIIINRMAEFKNLSPVDQPTGQTVLCAEVTDCSSDVAERVVDDLDAVGLLSCADVLDTMVLHHDYAYPVYDRRTTANRSRVQSAIAHYTNLHPLGRAATFEHWELDDAYAHAVHLVNRLAGQAPVALSAATAVAKKEEPTVAPGEPLVYVIVLAYNNMEDTIECLRSVREMSYPRFRTVLVDNGSTDGTPEQVRQLFPDVQVLENSANLGVPWGYNIGFSFALRAGADFVLMLNNDTTMDPDLLTELVKAGAGDPDAGILMPKVLYYDQPKRVWAIGGRYRRLPPAIVLMGRDQPDGESYDQPRLLEYAPSCGLLIRRQAFERAGLFDPGYFFFYDDWDFSRRVRAQGLRISFVPSARLYHKVGRSTGQGHSDLYWRVFGESSVRFYRRHGQPVWLSLAAHMGYLMLREFVVQGQWYGFRSFWAGVRAGLQKPLGGYPGWGDGAIDPNLQATAGEVRETEH